MTRIQQRAESTATSLRLQLNFRREIDDVPLRAEGLAKGKAIERGTELQSGSQSWHKAAACVCMYINTSRCAHTYGALMSQEGVEHVNLGRNEIAIKPHQN